MNAIARIHSAWLTAQPQMMTRPEYCAILRQIFHQVREHPQALGVFASRLRGDEARTLIPMILKHAT